MKILIIKMTSMGDIIHAFPALTDAGSAIETIKFDWVVENAFKELPKWHPLVDEVIPVSFRKWRKQAFKGATINELRQALKKIRAKKYDLIIDAQGLLKSTLVSLVGKGTRCGFDADSAREPWANFLYQRKASVGKNQHAVNRVRELFAKTLGYECPNTLPDYGLQAHTSQKADYLVFMPNTTWDTKHYPEAYWRELITLANKNNLPISIPWGAPHEEERAKRLAQNNPVVTVLPKMSLTEVSKVIAKAKGVIALDTGLAHIAAAFGVPTVSLYGPTDPKLTGALGSNQTWLSATFECAPCFKRQCQYPGEKTIDPPCFTTLAPARVWQELSNLIDS